LSPAIVHERPGEDRIVPVVEQLCPPGLAVAMYVEMCETPLAVGGDHEIESVDVPWVALTECGAPGTPVRALASVDAPELPDLSFATTFTTYTTPLVSPEILHSRNLVEHDLLFRPDAEAVAV
jgi:hypothetical protein